MTTNAEPTSPTIKEAKAKPGASWKQNEEHVVVESNDLRVGDRVFLMPQHACTTAYMYSDALVKTSSGGWEHRPQLGSAR